MTLTSKALLAAIRESSTSLEGLLEKFGRKNRARLLKLLDAAISRGELELMNGVFTHVANLGGEGQLCVIVQTRVIDDLELRAGRVVRRVAEQGNEAVVEVPTGVMRGARRRLHPSGLRKYE